MGKMGDSGFYNWLLLPNCPLAMALCSRRRPLSTNECGAWMRMLLEEGGVQNIRCEIFESLTEMHVPLVAGETRGIDGGPSYPRLPHRW